MGLIRAKKFRPVEMDHVFWHFRDPDLGFPSDVPCIFPKCLGVEEGGHIYPAYPTVFQESFDLAVSFRRHRTMGSNRFNQKKPLTPRQVEHYIGQLVMLSERNAEPREFGLFENKIQPRRLNLRFFSL